MKCEKCGSERFEWVYVDIFEANLPKCDHCGYWHTNTMVADKLLNQPGLKHDDGKVRLELVPPSLMMAVGEVMTYGANKYGAHNWRGVERERYQGALLRHLMAYLSGEVLDSESGLPHLHHVATNVAFLIELERSAE